MRNSGDILSRSEAVILEGARKWLRSESEALVRGSRGRGGGAGNEGVDGTRSEDDTTVLDRGFVLSFLCTGFDLMGFNSMGGLF